MKDQSVDPESQQRPEEQLVSVGGAGLIADNPGFGVWNFSTNRRQI